MFALSALMLFINGKGFNKYPGQKEWIISFCLFVCSLLSVTLRVYDFFFASVILGNTFQFLAYYTLCLGCLRFLGEDFTEHYIAFFFLAFLLVLMGTLSLEANFLNARIAIVSFLASIFSFGAVFFFWNFGKGEYYYEKWFINIFMFHGTFSMLKGLLNIIDHDREGLFSPTIVSQLTFYEYLLIAFLWGSVTNLLGQERLRKQKHQQNSQKLAAQ